MCYAGAFRRQSSTDANQVLKVSQSKGQHVRGSDRLPKSQRIVYENDKAIEKINFTTSLHTQSNTNNKGTKF